MLPATAALLEIDARKGYYGWDEGKFAKPRLQGNVPALTSSTAIFRSLSSNVLCPSRGGLAIAFQNLSKVFPGAEFIRESADRIDRDHPSQRPHRKPSKEVQWNPSHVVLRAGLDTANPDLGAGFIEPPRQEILLRDSILLHRVIDEG